MNRNIMTSKTPKCINSRYEENVNESPKNSSDGHKPPNNPLQKKRKRKLYSMKDDEIQIKRTVFLSSDDYIFNFTSDSDDEDLKLRKLEASTSAQTARINKGGIQKRTNGAESKIHSPSEEGISHVSEKHMTIFNFTSDSDDEDLKLRKLEASTSAQTARINKGGIQKRTNGAESKIHSPSEEGISHVSEKHRYPIRRVIPIKDLEDEKTRVTTRKELNSSFIAEKNLIVMDMEPDLIHLPQMEIIPEVNFEDKKDTQTIEKKSKVKKKSEMKLLKKEKQTKVIEENQKAESPLPALLIETTTKNIKDYQVPMKIFNKVIQASDYLKTSESLTTGSEHLNCSPEQPNISNVICDKLDANVPKTFVQNNTKIESSDLTDTRMYTNEGGPSVDIIQEWLSKQLPAQNAETDHFQCKEAICLILEKLGTTIPESTEGTSREFLQLFEDIANYSNEIEKRRMELYNDASKQITQIIAEVNERSAELQGEFAREFKRRGTELIRKHFEQKRAKVLMLKKDIEATMEKILGGRK